MRYQAIDPALFVTNRDNLYRHLSPKAMVVVHSNDILPSNADGILPFKQNSEIFYLSGVDQEESILILFPDCPNKKYREILFLKETSEDIAIWEGSKLTKNEAQQVSGIETIFWLDQFPTLIHTLMGLCEEVYLFTNEHDRAIIEVETRNARFIQWCQKQYPLHTYRRLAPLMEKLRPVKSPLEIDLMQKACDITEKGFRRVLSFVKPQVTEYEIEAEYLHEFVRNRSRGFAYEPIVASGKNACVLHYIQNNQICQDGDLLLMDVGAEYANYAADMTRTIPVNGRFSPRQKEVYQAVLRVMRGAMQMLRIGNVWVEYQKAVEELMEKELIDLGLLNLEEVKNQDPEKPLFKKYFMHGVSHPLGLSVHDLGSRYTPFEDRMVFTVEPGIYIREEDIGIRLENDVMIQGEGILDLMGNIPIEVEEIEELMNA